jgi:hypothetical protein
VRPNLRASADSCCCLTTALQREWMVPSARSLMSDGCQRPATKDSWSASH